MSDERKIGAAAVDYELLVAAYQASLTTVLRGFRGGERFLEGWAHDEDDAISIVSMMEAAQREGLPDLTVVVGRSTLDKLDRARVLELAAELGKVQISVNQDSTCNFTIAFGAVVIPASGRGGEALARAARARESRSARPEEVVARASDGVAGGTIHPVYRAALVGVLREPMSHEGDLQASPGLEFVKAEGEGGSLSALVDPVSHVVCSCRHAGGASPEERALLERLCGLLEGAPILEGADHAVIRLEHGLRDPTLPRPVRGVVTPESADPAFRPLTVLMRALLADYRVRTGYSDRENRYEWPPRAGWLALSPEGQIAALQRGLEAEVVRRSLQVGDVVCLRVDRGGRVTVAITAELRATEKARFAMDLEARIRREIEPSLHLYLDEMQDRNAIRRL